MKHHHSAVLAAAAVMAVPMSANALVYQFNATINSAQEVPVNATTGTGLGALFYDDRNTVTTTDDRYNFTMSVFGLTGPATAFHIHAPAPVGVNGPVVINLDSSLFFNANSFGILLVGGNNVPAPNASFFGQLLGSLAYINVHTAAFPGGEIRGQLVQVAVIPEPSTVAMLLAGLGFGGLMLRSRSRSRS